MKRLLPSLLMLALAACHRGPMPRPPALGFAVDGEPVTPAALDRLVADTGIHPKLVAFFLAWPAPNAPTYFPRESVESVSAAGAIPVLTWEPWVFDGAHPKTISANAILDGAYDAYLTSFARAARDFGRPLWIRLAHEMNSDHYHWGVAADAYGPETPFLYRDLFRHVVDIFRAQGVTNVRWIFCPNAESVPSPARSPAAAWNRASRYYPGDDYVDVLGMDGYNWGGTLADPAGAWRSQWQSFEEIFAPLHAELRQLAPTKPMIVFETASVSTGGDKAAWITAALGTAARWRLDAVCWFQVNKETDWRLEHDLTPETRQKILRESASVRLP